MDEKKSEGGYGSGYGKRPLWQWVLLYVVIAAVVYGLVYYFFFAGKGYSYQAPASGASTTQTSSY
jgi:hypothetical protein